jgi:sugar phosphate isomerase/epimerase
MRAHPSYPDNPYNIVADAGLRRRVRDDAAARGLFVALGSGFEINAGLPVSSLQPALEAAADMGARGLSVVVYDKDKSTHVDSVGELAERSEKLGLRALLEFFALSGVDSLPYTLELIERIGNPALGISMDTLHVARTGASIAEVGAVPEGLIVHAQLNDGPAHLATEKQLDEARGERLLPGEGEFELVGFVRALPPSVPIGVEAGSRSQFARGVTMEERGRAAIEATRRVITKALE